ncbi:MAG TPA: sensor histidine kinase [Pyrinomonadaceae bacterium]|jgi:signal transduction histidine kinase|nr:sensor histidine kinase [Pyrinomonadaceae bacterium]
MNKIEKLRKQLTSEANKKVADLGKVVEIITELSKLDPDFVRFTVDAGIINRLGEELVARQETALAELIKNAFDADAKSATLIFESTESPGGQLEVIDDGVGMTRQELIDGFMRLASTEKIEQPTSPKYKRKRAGRKGIGRFAVQRLGEELEITTQTLNSNKALRVNIDWSKFSRGKELTSVANRIKEFPKKREGEEGTTLVISKLRESWSEDDIKTVYKNVADLIQPTTLFDKRKTKESLATTQDKLKATEEEPQNADPGFKVVFYRRVDGALHVVASEETEILQHALAVVEGYVDKDGHGYWSVESEKLSISEPILEIGKDRENHKVPFEHLRNIDFIAHYFIHNSSLLPRSVKNTIKKLAAEKGGIRVYRNGFRVRPYGEPDNDWLGLDASTRAREILPPHANSNFFGFVEIIDPEGKQFEETSGRERLVENKAFEELQEFVSRVLKAAVLRVAEVRGKKRTASQKDWEKRNPAERIRDAAARLSQAISTARATAESKADNESKLEEYEELLHTTQQVVADLKVTARVQEDLLQELGMLRVLATLGLVIGEFTHEVKATLYSASLAAKNLVYSLKKGSKELRIAEDLKFNIERFQTYASYFDDAISENTKRELHPQNLRVLVKRFAETITPAASATGIKVEQPQYEGYDLITRPMHSSELSSIFFNLYTNAQKAILRANSKGKILLRAGKDKSRVYVDFADNGDGVPPENAERIFNAFFTTSSPAGRRAKEDDELRGSGLGLKIVKDIVDSYEGNISLVDPPATYRTCFRVEIPRATDKDLEEHAYKIHLS